jgi:hypothetical protein
MDFGDGFWPAVGWAAAIAPALATGTSTMVAIRWWRVDMTRADFLPFAGMSRRIAADRHGNADGPPTAETEIANVGDGSAYRLSAVGIGCRAQIESAEVKGGGGSGYRVRDGFRVVARAEPGWLERLRVYCEAAVWGDAWAVLTWTESPTWRGRRSRRTAWLPLTDVAPRPTCGCRETDEESGRSEFQARREPAGPVLPEAPGPQVPLPGAARRGRRWRRAINQRLLPGGVRVRHDEKQPGHWSKPRPI